MQRYTPCTKEPDGRLDMLPCEDGDYVLYADDQERIKKLEDALRGYRERHRECSEGGRTMSGRDERCESCRAADELLAVPVEGK